MFVYGGASAPSVANGWQGDTFWNQMLVDAGYLVVKVDNRTAKGIIKHLENLTVNRVSEAETPDLVAAARWLKKQPWVVCVPEICLVRLHFMKLQLKISNALSQFSNPRRQHRLL
jgi:hypothetical protein